MRTAILALAALPAFAQLVSHADAPIRIDQPQANAQHAGAVDVVAIHPHDHVASAQSGALRG